MNETLQNMFRNVTDQVSQLVGGYLPNLLGALGILVIGWLVALVVARVVRGALKRTTIDNRIAAWMGASQELEVERYAGKTAYWLIMLFVLVAFFDREADDFRVRPFPLVPLRANPVSLVLGRRHHTQSLRPRRRPGDPHNPAPSTGGTRRVHEGVRL